jgi:hypothetical protein
MRWQTWLVVLAAGCGVASVEGPAGADAGSPFIVGGLGGAGGGSPASSLPTAGGGAVAAQPGVGDAGAAHDAGGMVDTGFANARFELPDAGGADAGPMTCAWLDGPNCWKRQVDRFRDCGVPVGAVGHFAPDGRSCAFDGGAVLDFSSQVPERPDGGTTFWVTAVRLRDGRGASCFETAFALGRGRFRSGGEDVYSHSTSLLTYEIICPDGRRYDNVRENGACDTFGLRFLGGTVPGFDVACDAAECRVVFTGAGDGRRIAARCRRE